jgi:hypothetical protein
MPLHFQICKIYPCAWILSMLIKHSPRVVVRSARDGSVTAILRILNPSEKAAKTCSSYNRRCSLLLFYGASVYILVTFHVLANVANAPFFASYRRCLSRRFVFSSSAAPTAPPGSVFLASPGCQWFHLNLNCPR